MLINLCRFWPVIISELLRRSKACGWSNGTLGFACFLNSVACLNLAMDWSRSGLRPLTLETVFATACYQKLAVCHLGYCFLKNVDPFRIDRHLGVDHAKPATFEFLCALISLPFPLLGKYVQTLKYDTNACSASELAVSLRMSSAATSSVITTIYICEKGEPLLNLIITLHQIVILLFMYAIFIII